MSVNDPLGLDEVNEESARRAARAWSRRERAAEHLEELREHREELARDGATAESAEDRWSAVRRARTEAAAAHDEAARTHELSADAHDRAADLQQGLDATTDVTAHRRAAEHDRDQARQAHQDAQRDREEPPDPA